MPHGIYVPEDAETRAIRAGEKWRPSNGTEGEIFHASWCDHCKRDAHQDCSIRGDTYCYDVNDPKYPREWQYGDDGQPKCTAFEPYNS